MIDEQSIEQLYANASSNKAEAEQIIGIRNKLNELSKQISDKEEVANACTSEIKLFVNLIQTDHTLTDTDKKHMLDTVNMDTEVVSTIAQEIAEKKQSYMEYKKIMKNITKSERMPIEQDFNPSAMGNVSDAETLTGKIGNLFTSALMLIKNSTKEAIQKYKDEIKKSNDFDTLNSNLRKKYIVYNWHKDVQSINQTVHISTLSKELKKSKLYHNTYDSYKTHIEKSVIRRRGLEKMKDGATYMFGKDIPKHDKIVATPEQLEKLENLKNKVKAFDDKMQMSYNKCQQYHNNTIIARQECKKACMEMNKELLKKYGYIYDLPGNTVQEKVQHIVGTYEAYMAAEKSYDQDVANELDQVNKKYGDRIFSNIMIIDHGSMGTPLEFAKCPIDNNLDDLEEKYETAVLSAAFDPDVANAARDVLDKKGADMSSFDSIVASASDPNKDEDRFNIHCDRDIDKHAHHHDLSLQYEGKTATTLSETSLFSEQKALDKATVNINKQAGKEYKKLDDDFIH